MTKICGIYCIENLINNKKYIGQSVDIYKRWVGHKNSFNRKDHANIHLQSAWEKYGENNFEFTIIERCSKEKLNDKEIYYIKLFDTSNPRFGYNMTLGGDSFDVTDEYREYISSQRLKHSNSNLRKVLQIDLRGNIVKEFCCVGEIIRTTNYNDRHIRNCLKHKDGCKTSNEYIWIYKDEYDVKTFDLDYYLSARNTRARIICQLDLCGNIICFYNSTYEASKKLNIPAQNINRCLSGGTKTAHGFKWEIYGNV